MNADDIIAFLLLLLVSTARQLCPRWHQTVLGLSWAGNLVLLGAVTTLAVLVSQGPLQSPQRPAAPQSTESSNLRAVGQSPTRSAGSLEVFRASLKQNLCETENSSAGGSECKLCPRHWVPHRDKCYWLSNGSNYWNRSRDDCSRRRSHLLVIQDQEEMAFIQNIRKDQNPVWIGLNVTSPGRKWTWVDGSLLNQTQFKVSGPVDRNSCAAIRRNQIQSEICNTDFKWICQKAAVLI